MFYSGITVRELINSIKDEADIAPVVNDDNYIHWINALEQMLYSEIIKEQNESVIVAELGTIKISDIEQNGTDEAPIRFEDIHAMYAHSDDTIDSKNVQLKKSTPATGDYLPNCYFKLENNICFSQGFYDKELYPNGRAVRIIYFSRPKLKTKNTMEIDEIMLPAEFVELMKAKIRGEAYKLANEDALAAKWLNDYNVLLENFKIWISSKSPSFGI